MHQDSDFVKVSVAPNLPPVYVRRVQAWYGDNPIIDYKGNKWMHFMGIARALGVSRQSVFLARERGALRSIRHNGLMLARLEDVELWYHARWVSGRNKHRYGGA